MVRDPNIVRSGLSGTIRQDGLSVEVEIYRLEDETDWVLEVVDPFGTATVWDDQFESDEDAMEAFRNVLAEEGIGAFSETQIIPFPTRH